MGGVNQPFATRWRGIYGTTLTKPTARLSWFQGSVLLPFDVNLSQVQALNTIVEISPSSVSAKTLTYCINIRLIILRWRFSSIIQR